MSYHRGCGDSLLPQGLPESQGAAHPSGIDWVTASSPRGHILVLPWVPPDMRSRVGLGLQENREGLSICCFPMCCVEPPHPALKARKGSVVKSAGKVPLSPLGVSQGPLAREQPVQLCVNRAPWGCSALPRTPSHLMSNNTRTQYCEGHPWENNVPGSQHARTHTIIRCCYLHFKDINRKLLHSTPCIPDSVLSASHDINAFCPHDNPMRQILPPFSR